MSVGMTKRLIFECAVFAVKWRRACTTAFLELLTLCIIINIRALVVGQTVNDTLAYPENWCIFSWTVCFINKCAR